MVVSKNNWLATGLRLQAPLVCVLGLWIFVAVSCGGNSSQQTNLNTPTEESTQTAGGSFPNTPPSTMKELNYLQPDLSNRGNQFVIEPDYPQGHIDVAGISAVFSPVWADGKQHSANLAFGIYAFNIPGYDLEQSVSFEFSKISTLSDAWVGVANYSKDSWDWFPMPEGFSLELDFQDYLHPDTETILVLPLFMGTQEWILDRVRIGPDFGEGEIRVLDGYVYENDGSSPKLDVEVNISGDNTFETTTNLAGYWVEYFVPEGDYTVSPYEYTRRFYPGSRELILSGGDQTVEPFIDANVPLFPAHGLVFWPNGISPMPYLDVQIDGDDHGWIATDRDGIWSAELPDGNYVVQPVSEGWTFIPDSREFTIAGEPVEVGQFIAQAVVPQRIEGYIFEEDGETPLAGVTIFVDGHYPYQKVTDVHGFWRVMEIYPGEYRVTPFLDGTVFEPEFVDLNITNEWIELEPFIASPAPHSILDGTVVEQGSGDPVADISVTIANRNYSYETTTNQEGVWTVAGITPGVYSVIADAVAWTFVPDKYSIPLTDSDITVDPFIAIPRHPYAVFGYILDEDGLSPLGGVTVWLTGDGVHETVSGSDGFWGIPDVLEGNYLVQPVKNGREFDPETRVITVSGEPHRVDDFTLVYIPRHSVSGFIWTDTWPTPMEGVLVTVANINFKYETTTDSEGNWQIDDVLDAYYYIWGEQYGYTFDPYWVEELLDGEDLVVEPIEGILLDTYIVDGFVFENDGTTPVAAAEVFLEGDYDYSAVTAATGYWFIEGVFESEYEVRAEKLGWEFTPVTQNIAVDSSDETVDDFLGTEMIWYELTGQVFAADGITPFPDVQVIAQGAIDRASNTDAFGNFTIMLLNGEYSVFPQKAGNIFSPLSRQAIINDGDLVLDAFIDTGE